MLLVLGGVPVAFWPALYDDFTLPKQSLLVAGCSVLITGVTWSGRWKIPHRLIVAGLAAWVVIAIASAMTGLDRRGSVLGYYQYRQGVVTQLAYVGVFAGGFALASSGRSWVMAGAGAGLAGVLAYTLVQAFGLDPIDWWIDTSDRAIGTIGNANELAAFGVIAMGVVAFLPARWAPAGAGAAWGAALFFAMEAESRSGLAAVALFLALLAPAEWLAGRSGRRLVRYAAPAAAGLAVAASVSLAAGGMAGTAGRVGGESTAQETAGSTRIALWTGTLSVIGARPLLGSGPDGLHLAFPRDRPADLPGAYESYDLVAQSSHNIVLDSAANLGAGGLAAVAALVVGSALVSVRAVRGGAGHAGPDWPVAWAAMGAYGALMLVNPVSLAAHTLFMAMLGTAAGEALGEHAAPARASWRPGALAGVCAAAAVGFAGLLLAADMRAQAGWDAFATGDFVKAAAEYRAAGALAPTERAYASRETVALVAATSIDPGRAPGTEAKLREFDRQFGFNSGSAFDLAAVLIAQGRPASEVDAVVDSALALNPHGVFAAQYAERLRVAAREGGILRFDAKDRWTAVEVRGAP